MTPAKWDEIINNPDKDCTIGKIEQAQIKALRKEARTRQITRTRKTHMIKNSRRVNKCKNTAVYGLLYIRYIKNSSSMTATTVNVKSSCYK
ncbi:MAG: hypothetical protein LBC12_06620 [Nitrososphaerota archaeon]|nr:hypothetical protein [Nitrososphaerota archaeon]